MGCVPNVIVGRLKLCPHLKHFSVSDSHNCTINTLVVVVDGDDDVADVYLSKRNKSVPVTKTTSVVFIQNIRNIHLLCQVVNLAVEVNKVNVKL